MSSSAYTASLSALALIAIICELALLDFSILTVALPSFTPFAFSAAIIIVISSSAQALTAAIREIATLVANGPVLAVVSLISCNVLFQTLVIKQIIQNPYSLRKTRQRVNT